MFNYLLKFIFFISFLFFLGCKKQKKPLQEQNIQSKVENGKNINHAKTPFLVMYETENDEVLAVCTGYFISKRWILTAAHCFDKGRIPTIFLEGANIYVNVNGEPFSIFENPLYAKLETNPKSYVRHPRYGLSAEFWLHDVALVELSKDFDFSAKLAPLAIAKSTDYKLQQGSYATSVGWKKLDRNAPNSLQEALVRIYNLYENAVENTIQISVRGFQNDSAGVRLGDSGGPLLRVDNKGRTVSIGILSAADFKNKEVEADYTGIMNQAIRNWILQTTKLVDPRIIQVGNRISMQVRNTYWENNAIATDLADGIITESSIGIKAFIQKDFDEQVYVPSGIDSKRYFPASYDGEYLIANLPFDEFGENEKKIAVGFEWNFGEYKLLEIKSIILPNKRSFGTSTMSSRDVKYDICQGDPDCIDNIEINEQKTQTYYEDNERSVLTQTSFEANGHLDRSIVSTVDKGNLTAYKDYLKAYLTMPVLLTTFMISYNIRGSRAGEQTAVFSGPIKSKPFENPFITYSSSNGINVKMANVEGIGAYDIYLKRGTNIAELANQPENYMYTQNKTGAVDYTIPISVLNPKSGEYFQVLVQPAQSGVYSHKIFSNIVSANNILLPANIISTKLCRVSSDAAYTMQVKWQEVFVTTEEESFRYFVELGKHAYDWSTKPPHYQARVL
ncbi:MAG: S1 family peptidase, partial [Bacteroidota bacterium]